MAQSGWTSVWMGREEQLELEKAGFRRMERKDGNRAVWRARVNCAKVISNNDKDEEDEGEGQSSIESSVSA